MGQAINRNRRLLSSQNISSVNTIWGGHLKISNTNPNVTPMVWNAIGPDGNTNVDNVQNIHNVSPESIFPPLPITTDWMTHMAYLPMDKVDPTKLDDYYINNAIKGNKTFYNLTKGRLFKLCMHPVSSRMYWQRMYTPGYDMMFSPIIGTPSDYDNGDCLLFTNAFKISDQSYNIVKYNTLTMEITVLHTWFIEPTRYNYNSLNYTISSSLIRYNGTFDGASSDSPSVSMYNDDGTFINNTPSGRSEHYVKYMLNKNNSIRLFTWCDYLRNGTYAILKYGDGTNYELNTSSNNVYDVNNSLLKYDLYTNTITTILSSIPNLSDHGRPKFIYNFNSTRDNLALIFEEAGEVYIYNNFIRVSSTDICYSLRTFIDDTGTHKRNAACLSLVNQRMIFGKDLYGVANIKNKNKRLEEIYHNLYALCRFNNPYIENYTATSANIREQAPWFRFLSVNLINNTVIQDIRERPNENQYRLKYAQIPGLSYICLGYNAGLYPFINYTSVTNGSVYPLYNTKYRGETPAFIIENIGYFEYGNMTYNSSTTTNGMYTMNRSSYEWSANQLFLFNEIKSNSYNSSETNTNPAIALHKAYSFQYPHPSSMINDDGSVRVVSANMIMYNCIILNSGNCILTFPNLSYGSYEYGMSDLRYAFKDRLGNKKRNCLYIGQTNYEQTSIDYYSNLDATADKNKYIGIYDWKQKYNLYGETKYRDYLSEFRVPLYNYRNPYFTAFTNGTIQPN